MSETKRYRGGRAIAVVLDKLGWLAAGLGVAMGAYAVLTTSSDWVSQLAAGIPGLILSLVGVIAVTVAQLTRAAMDATESMRELVHLSKSRPQPNPEAAAALRVAAQMAQESPPADDTPPPQRAPAPKTGTDTPRLTAPKTERKDPKIHPIFSARPPRSS